MHVTQSDEYHALTCPEKKQIPAAWKDPKKLKPIPNYPPAHSKVKWYTPKK